MTRILTSLLCEDGVWAMPPIVTWYQGRPAIAGFLRDYGFNKTLLGSIAAVYGTKYDWNVTVAGGQFDAPYGAPTAGPPPYQPYEIRPTAVFGFVNDSALGPSSTRWRF